MKKISSEIKTGKILVSDGAWGTFLHKKGLQTGECPEMWNLSHRSDVLDIAKSYVAAGADMIESNSFGGTRFKLEHFKCTDKVAEINRAAASISREAAGPDRHVIASVGPTGKILMMGDVTEDELYSAFAEQASALEAGGADAVCIETMSAIDEAVCAVQAAKKETKLAIICTFTFEKTVNNDYRTMMGVAPADIIVPLIEAGADVIGTNCGNGMAGMIEIVAAIRSVNRSVPILVHANAGAPQMTDAGFVFPETPEMMSSLVPDLINAGANIVGGCCGTTPEHIKAMLKMVRRQSN